MTISNAIGENPYTGNGSTATYGFTFAVNAATEVVVVETDTAGTSRTLTYGTEYSVTGVNVATGGTVTRIAGVLPSGYKWVIKSTIPLLQDTSIKNQSGFFPDVVERAFDRVVRMIQQVSNKVGRQITVPDTDPAIGPLPSKALRALKAFWFDAAGDPTVTGSVTSLPDSSVTLVIDTIAQLKALTAPASAVTYLVRGYYAAGDGGGGTFRWNSADSSTEIGGMIIQPGAGGAGRWNRVFSEILNVAWFGAKGDGINDDTTPIQAALDYAGQSSIAAATPAQAYRYGRKVAIGRGVYKTTAPIYIPAYVTLIGDGAPPFNFNAAAGTVSGTVIYFQSGTTNQSAIRIVGFVAATGLRYSAEAGFFNGSGVSGGTYTGCDQASVQDLMVYSTAGHARGILALGAPRFYARGVTTRGFSTGILHQAGWGSKLEMCTSMSATIGFQFGSDSNSCVMDTVYADGALSGAGGIGISIVSAPDTLLLACVSENYEIAHSLNGAPGVTVINPWSEGAGVLKIFDLTSISSFTCIGGMVDCVNAALISTTTIASGTVSGVRLNNLLKVLGTLAATSNFEFTGITPKAADIAALATIDVNSAISFRPTNKIEYIGNAAIFKQHQLGAASTEQHGIYNNGVFLYSVAYTPTGFQVLNSGGSPLWTIRTDGGYRMAAGNGVDFYSGFNTPEGNVVANVGSIFMRSNGGAGTSMYVKESGTGNTGWVGK